MITTIKPDNKTENVSQVGKRYMFWRPEASDNETFSFCSTLENIGVIDRHDCSLKNRTIVLVLSDPTIADHLFHGRISVIRIMADKPMWIGTHTLWPIEGE